MILEPIRTCIGAGGKKYLYYNCIGCGREIQRLQKFNTKKGDGPRCFNCQNKRNKEIFDAKKKKHEDDMFKKGVKEAGDKIIKMMYNIHGYSMNAVVINDIRTIINDICEGGEKNGPLNQYVITFCNRKDTNSDFRTTTYVAKTSQEAVDKFRDEIGDDAYRYSIVSIKMIVYDWE